MNESVGSRTHSPAVVNQVGVNPKPKAHVLVEHEVEHSTTRYVLVVILATVLEGHECTCILERYKHTLDTTGRTTSDGTHCVM